MLWCSLLAELNGSRQGGDGGGLLCAPEKLGKPRVSLAYRGDKDTERRQGLRGEKKADCWVCFHALWDKVETKTTISGTCSLFGPSTRRGRRAELTKSRASALLPLSCQGRLFDLCSLAVSIKTKRRPDMCSISRCAAARP